jgi:hypothetical protein
MVRYDSPDLVFGRVSYGIWDVVEMRSGRAEGGSTGGM